MNISKLNRNHRSFEIIWSDNSITEFPFIWLRDNDPHELHPDTKERTFDLTSVSINITPDSFSLNDNTLTVRWPERTDDSCYSSAWLYAHRPGHSRTDPCAIIRKSWTKQEMPELPRINAKQCAQSPKALLDALISLKTYGILIVAELDDDPHAGERFGDLIGFKRETNFGVMFEVKNKAEPNNLAYTARALPLHTDLANQESVPGFQFLHCYRNEAEGGGSLFSDALAACESLKEDHPGYYDFLSRTSVPWRFHDETCDLRQRRPVIELDRNNQFKGLTLNPHLADIPDLTTDLLYDFYTAYQELMRRTRSPKYVLEYVLQSGEMAVFDNRRVLHGRASFDPSSGDRHLRGYYIEHNEVENRIRMLSIN